jgi:hypothetical protein
MTEPSVKRIELGPCQVCDREPAVGVASMPGIPMSFAYGRQCLQANAHPIEIVVGNTALMGGMDAAAEWWWELVSDTLAHLGIRRAEFNDMVDQAIKDEEEYFAEEAADETAAEAEAAQLAAVAAHAVDTDDE